MHKAVTTALLLIIGPNSLWAYAPLPEFFPSHPTCVPLVAVQKKPPEPAPATTEVYGYSYSGTSNFINRTITRNSLGFKTIENIAAGLEPTPLSGKQFRKHNAADQLIHNSRNNYNPDHYYDLYAFYDSNGNLTNWTTISGSNIIVNVAAYDAENRMTSFITAGITNRYEYDAQGNRIKRIENGTTNFFVLDYADSLNRPLMELNATGGVVRYFVWANNGLLSQIEANGTIRYVHSDELGSTLGLTDMSGNLTDEYAYTPYGVLIEHVGTNDTPFLYIGGGGVYYEGSDLYRMGARFYDANLMKWIQQDPSGLADNFNMYCYAMNNPAFYTDVLGLWAGVDDAIALGGGALLGVAGQGVADWYAGQASDWEDYVGAAIGGATFGETLLYTGPVAAGAAGGLLGNTTSQGLKKFTQKRDFSVGELAIETGLGAATGLIPGQKIAGVTAGRGSYEAVANQMITKIKNEQIQNISVKTGGKLVTAKFVRGAALESAAAGGITHGIVGPIIPDIGRGVLGNNVHNNTSVIKPKK